MARKQTTAEKLAEQAAAAQQTPPVLSWLQQPEEAPEPAPTTEPTVDTEKPEAASKGQQEPTTDTGKRKTIPPPRRRRSGKSPRAGKSLFPAISMNPTMNSLKSWHEAGPL
jgi:hypothetical protein